MHTLTLDTEQGSSTPEPTTELHMVISEFSEKRMVTKGTRGVHPKSQANVSLAVVIVWPLHTRTATRLEMPGHSCEFVEAHPPLSSEKFCALCPHISRPPFSCSLVSCFFLMSIPTVEERKGLALAACFNDKRRHHRLIGHQARTFDFQVSPAQQSAFLNQTHNGEEREGSDLHAKCFQDMFRVMGI